MREYAKEVRLFNIGEYIANRWFKTSQLYSKAYRHTLWRQERSIFTVQVMSSVFYVACVVFIANSTINQTLTIGLFVALIQAVQRFQEHINLLTSQLAFYVQFSTPIGVAYKFLEDDAPNNKNEEQLAELPTCIEFDSVSFKYLGSEEFALRDISFVINAGERIAICGQNGAGKSTLVKLILGFYRPSEGVIRINGKDISELDMEQIRQKITTVFQDFVRYQLRFRENIGFGNISQITDDHKLFEVASKVKVDDLIHNAPNSMDTQLGNQFTNGMDISGGQWQKLAIARAHLKNASIIVMDEPTSALDPMSEAGLYKDFLEISGENTAIYISHRTGLARLADRIIVLKDGLLIEDGSHDELLNNDGEYADFFNSQAKWYKNPELF
jgi:ATP-binding cassette subfamily B protein